MPAVVPARARQKPQSYLRFLFGLVLTVGILYLAKSVIVPLALAILLTFILTPLVAFVQRRGLARVYAALLVVTLALAVFAAVAWGVGSQLTKLASDLPQHAAEIKAKTARLRGSGSGPFSRVLDLFQEISKAPVEAAGGAAGSPSEKSAAEKSVVEKSVVVARLETPSALERLSTVAVMVLEPVASAGLILILVIFMLIKREDLRNRIIGLLGHGRLTGTTRVLVEAAERLSRFLLMQLCVNAGFGLVFGVALWLIGVPYWFLWGFLTAVLRFIPYVGTWLAAALPVILSFAISPGWTQPIVVLVVFMVLDLGTANVLEPLLFGHSTGVSAVALLVAAAFWTWVWGPIGLVLSTPLTVCLVVLGQHVPRLRFLSLILGDQPALAPAASYYQRLLANDREEAALVAKEYATAKGMDHVYDDVFLPALRLARRDRKSAGLTAEDETFIYDATRDILNRLRATSTGEQARVEASAASSAQVVPADRIEQRETPALVFGCPAHHKAEELTLHMLAQVMKPIGCRVEVMSTKTRPAEIEARIDREHPSIVFVAVLSQGLVQARYLCKRLRERFPELKIVVGYWGRARDFDKLLVSLRRAGASYVTTSLIQSQSQLRALLPVPAARENEHEAVTGAPVLFPADAPAAGA